MKEVPVHVCAYILVFVFQRNPYGTIFELPPKIVGLHNAICIFMICKFWQLRIRDQKICTTIWARIWVGKVLYRHRKRKCIFPTTGCCLFFFSRQNLFFPAKTCFSFSYRYFFLVAASNDSFTTEFYANPVAIGDFEKHCAQRRKYPVLLQIEFNNATREDELLVSHKYGWIDATVKSFPKIVNKANRTSLCL